MLDKNQVSKIIRDNITRCYIFYIPKRYYPDIEKTFFKDIIKSDMVNIISYLNLDRKSTSNPLEFNGLDILNKGSLLNDNIDQLIDQKEKLSETLFNHLMEQYKEYIDAHGIIVSWMFENLMIDLPNTSPTLLNMFESQAFIFKKHQEKFQSYFGIKETLKKININQYIKVSNETIKESPLIEIENQEQKPAIDQELKTPPEKEEKKEKEPLMKDEKARKFLLETVFNIEPKYLD